MSQTRAVPLEWLARASRTATTGRPLCPSCKAGCLQPYRVEVDLAAEPGGWQGADALVGWVVICSGNADEVANKRRLYEEVEQVPPDDDPVHPACGFSMPMTPQVAA